MKESFFDVLKLLADGNVDFVIIGGFAGVIHGCSYVTQDIDVCLDSSISNLLRLAKALKRVHPVHRMTPKKLKLELNKDNASQFKNLYLDTDIGQLDCLSFVHGVGDYHKVKENSLLIDVEGVKMRVLNIEALIESKKAMNRPKDRLMLEQSKRIKKAAR